MHDSSRIINVTRWVLITLLVCIYCFSFVLPLMNAQRDFGDYIFPVKELINLGVAITIFMLNYFVLIPELFAKKHFLLYSCSALLLIIVIIGQQVFVEYMVLDEMQDRFFTGPPAGGVISHAVMADSVQFLPPQGAIGMPVQFPLPESGPVPVLAPAPSRFFTDIILPQTLMKSAFLAVIIFFTGGFFTAGINWLRTDVQKQQLEKKQLESELKFLKTQINPHFLFNCLNSIYMLTRKDAEQARFGIHRLSSFLRYLLRASEVSRVPLLWELDAIEDYVSLQRTRLPAHVKLNFEIVKTQSPLVIEPMLLLPLIENVFKHGIDPELQSEIKIHLVVHGRELTLVTINPVVQQPAASANGIGIRNIESRLDISYPGRSELAYIQSSNEFLLKLFIRLDDELHHY
jgi:two-component system, LytTR family, sensor kinase